jgi:hypothetical protein
MCLSILGYLISRILFGGGGGPVCFCTPINR